ncbi:MAG: GNAT family N-acetyltransferase [Leptolyngbyaceae cyanobacterium RU_5_1]|nr:GNAT family N-acetyltransferase [Leptolyngbyaceae cyanobacterium RU_5_1]
MGIRVQVGKKNCTAVRPAHLIDCDICPIRSSMTAYPSALPHPCLIRPARSIDKPLIRSLLKQFRQEVVPPISRSEQVWRAVAIALVGGVGIYMAIAIGLPELMNLLVGSAIVVGLGALTAFFLTWNDDWEDFWVIEHNRTLVACAKLRSYSHYSVLHDLFVLPEWRSQGLGSYLVTYLGAQATKPLYLTCLPALMQFYLRLGFTPVSAKNLPPLLLYDLGIPGRVKVIPLVLT